MAAPGDVYSPGSPATPTKRTLAARIDAAFVFGAAARGELHAGSDIDLMLIGDTSFGDVITVAQGAEKRLGRDVNPTVYSLDEFRGKIEAKHHFLMTLLAEPKLFVQR